jgi:hypothetical protein
MADPEPDDRPADLLFADLLSEDEDVRRRVALEIERRTMRRVFDLGGSGLPQERVKRTLLEEWRRDMHRLPSGSAARLVLLAIDHEDCGRRGGDSAYVRCIGSTLDAWGPAAAGAGETLLGLLGHSSPRLRGLAESGLRATGVRRPPGMPGRRP